MPIVFRLPALAKLLGVPYVPVTANMLALGPLGVLGYFPSKFKLRVLDPVRFDMPSGQERYSKSRIMDEAESIRTAHAGDDLRHAARPPQRLVRLKRWDAGSS